MRRAPASPRWKRRSLPDAVVKESMRILPATPMLFIRVAAGRAMVGPCELPKGTAIVLSPLVSHHMPDVFSEPRRFRPERWSALQPSPHEYLPFGVGPRMCIGAGFAALVIRLVVGTLVQRHRLSLAPNLRVSTRLSGITLGPKHGLPMRVLRDAEAPPRRIGVRGNIHDIVDLS